MKYSKYSTVIIGTGIAGLYFALKSSESSNLPDGILLVNKSNFHESNSRYAQGGIVGVMTQNEGDSVNLHVDDTIKSGCDLGDPNVIKFISENSEAVINDLIDCGVNFDRDENNNLKFTLEGAHCRNRILHAGGDATGRCIEEALSEKVLKERNITIYENTTAVELLIDSNSHCRGVVLFNNFTHEYEVVYAGATVLASGGIGQLYECTTNPKVATGDGMALAYQAGAILQDMEFVQFHPTALAIDSKHGNRFLISEALRGEGAKLVDNSGRNFIEKYTPQKELAPRDIVTRAIFTEMQEQNISHVFLDATSIPKEKLQERFPTISQMCLMENIDISKDYIPVSPAAHYMMGGIKTNIEGVTSIPGLYALGEASCTGLHGANRLASNSLLECAVCAYELSNYLSFTNLKVSNKIDAVMHKTIQKYQTDEALVFCDIDQIKKKLQHLMWTNVGIYRTKATLEEALCEIKNMKSQLPMNAKLNNNDEYELRNMLIVASLITKSALEREESRGAHYRMDFPNTHDTAVHSYASIKDKTVPFLGKKENNIVFV